MLLQVVESFYGSHQFGSNSSHACCLCLDSLRVLENIAQPADAFPAEVDPRFAKELLLEAALKCKYVLKSPALNEIKINRSRIRGLYIPLYERGEVRVKLLHFPLLDVVLGVPILFIGIQALSG